MSSTSSTRVRTAGVERARAAGVEDVERRPIAPRVLERVVDVVEGSDRWGPRRQLAEEPELLVVPDVREVPAQGRHQLRHLPALLVVGDGREQAQRAAARLLERRDDLGLGDHVSGQRWGVRPESSSRSSAGQRARRTKRVEVLLGGGDGRGIRSRPARARAARRRSTERAASARAGSCNASRAAVPQRSRTPAVGRRRPLGGEWVVEQCDRDGHRDRPPLLGERVDHAQLEPAARPHRREERGDVVREVVGRRASRAAWPSRIHCSNEWGPRQGDAPGVVDAHHHHGRVEHVAAPVGARLLRLVASRRCGACGIDGVPHRGARRDGSPTVGPWRRTGSSRSTR